MTLLELLDAELRRLHGALDAAVADLTPDQWHFIPGDHPRANSVAFEVWHYVRTEDNIIRFILQNRRPTVWQEGGLSDRLGLPPIAQGTGMTSEDAHRLRITDIPAFRGYIANVWESSSDFLASIEPSDLDRTVLVRPLGEMPAARALGQVCVSHGFSHLGELELCRTLLNLDTVLGL